MALQLKRAGDLLVPAARTLAWELAEKAREHAGTLCVGRTHGVHAEPTSFGLKLAGYAMETHRNAERLERAFGQITGAISGAVGTYATLGPDYEERVMASLGLRHEDISTQVVPRDRHAELLSAIALTGAGLERFATEIRHLQRTEVREVEEPFRKGQKGSSAMPHKRNPVVCERICGLARVLRGNAQVGIENVALWHERDITHSSAERIVLPDSTILLDQVLALTLRVVRGMTVHADRMRANLEITSGALFSQRVLLALVAGGMQRDDAYRIVQRLGQQAWDTQTPAAYAARARERRDRSRRGVRLRLLRPPRADGAGAAGGDPIGILIFGAPELSATLFHEVPVNIGDPFLYLENEGRRAATVSILDAAKVAEHGIEILDPATLGERRPDRRRRPAAGDRGRAVPARRARAADHGGHGPARLPALRRRPSARQRARADGRRGRVHAPAAREVRRPARRHPARPEGRRRRDGHRAGPDPRAAPRPDLRGGPRRDAGGGRGARLRAHRRRDRLARRAVRDRPRFGLGRDPRG